jgi:hypothetical protein
LREEEKEIECRETNEKKKRSHVKQRLDVDDEFFAILLPLDLMLFFFPSPYPTNEKMINDGLNCD